MGYFEKRTLTNPGLAVGVALIFAGVLLFIDNLGIFYFRTIGLFWPVLLLFYGALILRWSSTPVGRVWGGMALFGSALLFVNAFHLARIGFGILWPLVLIAVGMTMLLYRLQWPAIAGRLTLGSNSSAQSDLDQVHEFAVFSGCRRRLDSANFTGGDLSSIFGGVEVDLRRARISALNGEAVVEANALFGGIEIRVPETWRVSLQGTAVFGAYEDKTFPPRPEPGVLNPVLVIRGGTLFGGVSVQN